MEQVQRKATNTIKVLEENMKTRSWRRSLCLDQRIGNMIIKYLKSCYGEGGQNISESFQKAKQQRQWFKLQGNNKTIWKWNRLPWETVNSLFLEMSKERLGLGLCSDGFLHQAGAGLSDLQHPPQTSYSVILRKQTHIFWLLECFSIKLLCDYHNQGQNIKGNYIIQA